MKGPAPLLASLTALLTKRRAELESLLARSAGAPEGEALHDVRVVLRRTVSLARLTRDVPRRNAGEPLRRAARDLRRALGARRSHEVAASILSSRFRKDPRRRAAAARVAARLLAVAGKAAPPGDLDVLLAELRTEFAARDASLARLASPLASSSLGRTNRRLAKAVQKRLSGRARRLVERGLPDAGNVHAARREARDLRYGLELAPLPGAARLGELLAAFQSAAGDAHDRLELIDLVRKTAGALAPRRRREALRLLPAVLADAERTLARARRVAQELLGPLRRASARW